MGHKTKPKNTKAEGGAKGGDTTRQYTNNNKKCDSRRKTYLEEIQCGGWVTGVYHHIVCMPMCVHVCVFMCVWAHVHALEFLQSSWNSESCTLFDLLSGH